jgi:hypothetical protein
VKQGLDFKGSNIFRNRAVFAMGVSLRIQHGLRSDVTRCSSSSRTLWRRIFAAVMVLVSLFGRGIAQDDATVGEDAAKTRSWTLWQRLLVTGDTSDVPKLSSLNWQVRGIIHLTATEEADVIEMRNSSEVPESLVRDIQTRDGRGGKTWYQLKLEGTEGDTATMILTSVPACHVVRAQFRDELLVHLQPLSGHALSLTYMPLISPWAPPSCADVVVNTTAPLSWDTKLTWDTAVPGMIVGQPPLVDPITKLAVGGGGKVKAPPGILWSPGGIPKKTNGAGEEDTNGNDKADPFAFLKRYWYIILPLLLMNVVAAGPPQETPASGGAAATTSPAAAPAAGGAARQRRGKKG